MSAWKLDLAQTDQADALHAASSNVNSIAISLLTGIAHDHSLPSTKPSIIGFARWTVAPSSKGQRSSGVMRSEEHTSELQSLMRISYAVFCLKKNTIYKLRTELLRIHEEWNKKK